MPEDLDQSNLSALQAIDTAWYNKVSQHGRWMDIIGDFAGEELFVIDGDSLLGIVLDDPSLAIGCKDHSENSFQFLHARYSLERLLQSYHERNAVFEVIFFEDHRHITCRTGSTEFVSASRVLARSLLTRSLRELGIPTQIFQNLSDDRWIQFFSTHKPMFVMTHDGGSVPESIDDNTEHQAACALIQRSFVFDLLAGGIAVALMQGVEFRDSKIFSFIYEQRRIINARSTLDTDIWTALSQASAKLDAKFPGTTIRPAPTTDRAEWLCISARNFLTCVPPQDNLAHPLLYVFIVHAFILDVIPIKLRAQPLAALPSSLESYLHVTFLPHLFHCLENSLPDTPTFRDIDLDGRTFLRLLQIFLSSPSIDDRVVQLLEPDVAVKISTVCTGAGVGTSLSTFCSRFNGFVVPDLVQKIRDPSALSVLPFSHPIFDDHLAPVRVDVDCTSSPSIARGYFDFGSGLGTLFDDRMHWHNSRRHILPKHLGGEDNKRTVSDPKLRNKALKRKPLEKIVIPPVGTRSQTSKTPNPRAHELRPTYKGAPKKLTSLERTRLQIQAQKQDKKTDEDSSWWKTILREMESPGVSLETRVQKVESLLRNARTAEGWLAVEVRLYRLHVELFRWIDHPERDNSSIRDKFRISILDMIKEQQPRAPPTVAAILASVLTALGFSDLVTSTSSGENSVISDRRLSFKFIKLVEKSGSPRYTFMRLDDSEPPTHWILRCFGEYMDRSLDSRSDQRVPFEPDGWQCKVLDALDKDASVLVVAPTSAGKTFISFYAMERVLRSSDDGILVYVAPTKALVMQIAAEVSVRFSKDIDGRGFWAIHTREYRIHDPQQCQILITVPEILAMMLLSPPLARVWTPRLRRIILDEIHSIGQEDGGSIWEQILLLAPCPIIGLSATVGKPDQFNRWLKSVQSGKQKKIQHTFIEHPHRYSHLRKFFYLRARKSSPFIGLSNHEPTDRLRFIHPVCLLGAGMTRALPPDFALEAKDCLSLFKSLRENARGEIGPAELEALDPTNFFPRDRLIKQEDVLRYETCLKSILERLIKAPGSHKASSMLQAVIRSVSDPAMTETPDGILATTAPKREMESDFINLISDLHSRGDLPALVFSFDRNKCEKLAKCLLSILVDAEETWRNESPEWRNKVRAWERYKARAKERERLAELSKRQRPDEDRRTSSENLSWEARFDPSDPSPAFSFAGIKTSYDKSSLDTDLDELRWTSTPTWALQAIKRGIAVHHSGMNRRYRNLVETLFRIGFLRVVIATGTLALGINAPCRTVIFYGDSTYLTALQFRQAAGRAGRRGFDLLGKVVFYGLPLERVQRVVLSRLPAISGQFPLSTTLCLRLFNLLAGSQNAPYAQEAISAILSLPQVSLGSEMGRDALLHQLRFSIDYLLRARLLSTDGQPLNLTGMVTHLYYHEPNNLAFVTLLQSGVIHNICNDPSRIDATHKLLLVLCHLFGRRHLPRSALNKNTLQSLRRSYPSVIVLPPLPHAAQQVLADHGNLTLNAFTGYACTYAAQYSTNLGEDNVLPLSGIKLVPPTISENEPEVSRLLRATSLTFAARSAFVATSGHTDLFSSVTELCRDARQGLYLNENAIPSMDAILAGDSSPFELNAYLFDFYTHGQVNTLVRANGIKRGEVWFLLQDFDLTLRTIKSSVQELLLKVAKQHKFSGDQDGDDENGDDVVRGDLNDHDEDGHIADDEFSRPLGVNEMDWKVYEVLSNLSKEFHEKFLKMWA